MPSHRIHRECGVSIGLPEDVVSFIDKLIDSGRCGEHDIGLELLKGLISEEYDLGVVIKHGVKALFECLQELGRFDEVHLKAVALHFILDYVDRQMKVFGTWCKENPEKFLQYCVKRMEEKWITQLNRYFFGSEDVKKQIDKLLQHTHTLVEKHKEDLKKCVIAIAEENEKIKGISPIGPATLTQLLSEVCNKLNAKGLFYINIRSKPLPLASAVTSAYSMLKKGEPVELASEDGKVKITAQSVNEFLEKLLQFLM
jgi:hypothetical protein